MRILYGLYSADEGQILVDGREVHIRSPKDAIRNRIGMVTSIHPGLAAERDRERGPGLHQGFALNPKALQARVAEAAGRFGIQVDPGRSCGTFRWASASAWRSSNRSTAMRAC